MNAVKAILCVALTLATACSVTTGLPEHAAISGTVCDTGGLPLESVAVSAEFGRTVTDSEGKYGFDYIEEGTYVLSFALPEYIGRAETVTVLSGRTHTLDVVMEPDPVVRSLTPVPAVLDFGADVDEIAMLLQPDLRKGADWSIDIADRSWLSATPAEGHLEPGEKAEIVFSVDRDGLSEETTQIPVLSMADCHIPVPVTCNVRRPSETVLDITPSALDFGEDLTSLKFEIKASGAASMWHSAADHEAVALSPAGGELLPGAASTVFVSLDRSRLPVGVFQSRVWVTCGNTDYDIPVSAVIAAAAGDDSTAEVPAGTTAFFPTMDSPDDALGYARAESRFGGGYDIVPAMIDSRQWSLSMWLKTSGADGMLWWVDSQGEVSQSLRLERGRLRYMMSRHENRFLYDAATSLFVHPTVSDGAFHHVVLCSRHSGDVVTTTLYVDGSYASDTYSYHNEIEAPHFGVAAALCFAAGVTAPSGTETAPVQATVRSMRVYGSRALDGSEVRELYHAEKDGNY